MTDEKTIKDLAEEMEIEVEDEGSDVDELSKWDIEINIPYPFLQKHLEKFQVRLSKLNGNSDRPLAVYNRLVAQVGVELGWVKGVDVLGLGNLEPYKISWTSRTLHAEILQRTVVPNE